MNDLPDELPRDIPKPVRTDYRSALESLQEKYTKRDIKIFLGRLREHLVQFIAANGLTLGSNQALVSVPMPRIPPDALTGTWKLLEALDSHHDINRSGLARYLGIDAVGRLKREDTENSRMKANRVRKENSETWKNVVREAATTEWRETPRASYESVGKSIYHNHPELSAEVKESTVIKYLKDEKLKTVGRAGRKRKKQAKKRKYIGR